MITTFLTTLAISFLFIQSYKSVIVDGPINQTFVFYIFVLTLILAAVAKAINHIIYTNVCSSSSVTDWIYELFSKAIRTTIAFLLLKLIFIASNLPNTFTIFMTITAIFLHFLF